MSRGAGRAARGAPTPDEVGDLYAAASQGPPLCEPRTQSAVYAELFADVLTRDDAAWVAARQGGTLVGVAYGHHWAWERQTDEWSAELRDRLGGPDAPNGRPGLVLGLHLLEQAPHSHPAMPPARAFPTVPAVVCHPHPLRSGHGQAPARGRRRHRAPAPGRQPRPVLHRRGR